MAAIFSTTAPRFVVGEVAVRGGWQVTDVVNGAVRQFGTDRFGALDYADHQNRAQARAEQFAAITSKCGVHADTTTHNTQRAAEMAARRSIKAGTADSAAVYDGHIPVKYLGSGR